MDPRIIPSIEQLRQRPALRALEATYGRETLVGALRQEAEALRGRLASGTGEPMPSDSASAAEHIERQVAHRLELSFRGSLRGVINATGVVIHTNLGRAPLASPAAERLMRAARGYSNLEYDIEAGHRGRRDVHASALLARLTGADSAVVVNNNAAAVMLVLAALGAGREVIVSRGELVEIGGGFRVPEVMAQSGAVLREVGTTNKTRAADYEAAITERTALILRVHRSNFRIEGFTEQPMLGELVAVARRAGVPVVEDLGSGLLDRVETPDEREGREPEAGFTFTFASEPTARASVAAGIDIVCFSGDKLLGGPQAGIIIGRHELVGRIARHPLMRAFRVDKLTYAALEATLLEYLAGRAVRTVPVLRMLSLTPGAIRARAAAVIESAGPCPAFEASLAEGHSMVGGGSAPGLTLPTCLIALTPRNRTAADIEAALRRLDPPIIARVENDRVLLDLRTAQEDEDTALAQALARVGR